MSANDIQHGGSHYKKHPIQIWDFIMANNIGYMEGSAIKYLCRWQDKGGIQDLQKAVHFIQRLIEEETKKQEAEKQARIDNEACIERSIQDANHAALLVQPLGAYGGRLYRNGGASRD
jgi:hypothetical protein